MGVQQQCIKEGEGVSCVPDERCIDCEKCPDEIRANGGGIIDMTREELENENKALRKELEKKKEK